MKNIIEVEVFNKLFSSIAEEMGIILRRSSFSSNIKERCDFSCATTRFIFTVMEAVLVPATRSFREPTAGR